MSQNAATQLLDSPVRERSMLRKVILPTEHGGWGLTAEPVILGLIVAPSLAGLSISLVAFIAFFARTPLRIILVNRHRNRDLDRTALARKVFIFEAIAIASLIAFALLAAPARFILPVVVAAPCVIVEFWFDARSKSRRLIPEIAGSIGICSVVAMIMLADNEPMSLSIAAWLVLSARSISAITRVRYLIQKLHSRNPQFNSVVLADIVALCVGYWAIMFTNKAVLGFVGIIAAMLVQSYFFINMKPAKVIGITQMFLGLLVVIFCAIGFSA